MNIMKFEDAYGRYIAINTDNIVYINYKDDSNDIRITLLSMVYDACGDERPTCSEEVVISFDTPADASKVYNIITKNSFYISSTIQATKIR